MASFITLPQELHDRIFHYLEDGLTRWHGANPRDMIALAQTCRAINAAVTPSLYQHIHINWEQARLRQVSFDMSDTTDLNMDLEDESCMEDHRLVNLLATFKRHPHYAQHVDSLYLNAAPCSPKALAHILRRTTRLTQL